MSKKTNDTEKSEEPKQCFIITPIGQAGSGINKKAFGLIDAVITPVLEKHSFVAIAASDISNSGSINKQIIKFLTEAPLVIANLTGLNPNVMYELAVRHAIRKPVIMMMERTDERLPFDVIDQRTVFYDDTLNGVNAAKDLLDDFVTAALNENEIQNPIYDSIEANQIIEKITTDEKPLQYLINRIDELSEYIKVNPSNRSSLAKGYTVSTKAWVYQLNLEDITAAELQVQNIRKILNDYNLTRDVKFEIIANGLRFSLAESNNEAKIRVDDYLNRHRVKFTIELKSISTTYQVA